MTEAVRTYPSAHVQRAAEDVYFQLVDVAEPARLVRHAVLAPKAGVGVRVHVWIHAKEERDLFGEHVRCLFRDRLLDLLAESKLAWRGDLAFSKRQRYRVTHVPTGVPVTLWVARSPAEWAAFERAKAS